MAVPKCTTPAGARLLVKIAHFKRDMKRLPPLDIPPHIRRAAEKLGHKFN